MSTWCWLLLLLLLCAGGAVIIVWTKVILSWWEMVEVELSPVQRKLLDYGIDEGVAAELDRIHQSGEFCVIYF